MQSAGSPLPVDGPFRARLRLAVPGYLARARWFGAKDRALRSVRFLDVLPFAEGRAAFFLVRVSFQSGAPQTLSLPLSVVSGRALQVITQEDEGAIVLPFTLAGAPAAIVDATEDPATRAALLALLDTGAPLRGANGRGAVTRTRMYGARRGRGRLVGQASRAEQSNSSIRFGERLMLKLFRRLEAGENPELELGRAFAARRFAHVPALVAAIEYRPRRGASSTLAVAHGFVPNRGDAWSSTLALLGRYFAAGGKRGGPPTAGLPRPAAGGDETTAPTATLLRRLRPSLAASALLGQRTAQMHRALAATRTAAFTPVQSTFADQRQLLASMTSLTRQTFAQLRDRLPRLELATRRAARALLKREAELLGRFARFAKAPHRFMRIRCHGDFHLGQVLDTGADFVISDFEGEPTRSLAARRRRQSPLRDVAGMLRSFHYAALTGLARAAAPRLEPLADLWYQRCSRSFLDGYFAEARGAAFLPDDLAERTELLELFMLEKAVYELGYETGNRPEWLSIPLQGLTQLLDRERP